MKKEEIKKSVSRRYTRIAQEGNSCCNTSSCCSSSASSRNISKSVGYAEEELETVPDGANLGLGCGNPVALASLREGEIVLDLGAGAGLDCFLAASKVGKSGRVIGVDMTPEMIYRARENAREGNYENVEFRLGEIENLPAADDSVDTVISNCVINLSPDKRRVFGEAFRVLKPGGRLVISDIVLLKPLPDIIKDSIEAYTACIAGAMLRDAYIGDIKAAGFQEIRVIDETPFPVDYADDPTVKEFIASPGIAPKDIAEVAGSVISIKLYAVKPD